jgi:hypothetical protein
MRSVGRKPACAGLLAALAGCATPPQNGPAEEQQVDSRPAVVVTAPVNLSGYSAEFKQGYADGCESAGLLRAHKRNEPRYQKDAQYQQGWDDGYSICGGRR